MSLRMGLKFLRFFIVERNLSVKRITRGLKTTMKAKRLWWTIRLALTPGGGKRTSYARKNKIYGAMGENVYIQSRVIPLYSELIKFHNNIAIARNVDFCTHDIIHTMLNRIQRDLKFKERIGCIEIMDNVFVGSNSVILYGTKIGPNVIIASGSVVTKDCEPDSVYAGCPAMKVGSLSDFIERRKTGEADGSIPTTTHNQALTDEEIQNAWKEFDEVH